MAHIQIGNRIITEAEILPLLAEYQILPQFQRSLIISEAIAPIQCTPQEVTNALEQFYEKHQISTPQDKEAWLKHYSITLKRLEIIATTELRIEKLKLATWGSKLESLFLQYKPQLDKVLYSLLRIQDAEIAQELYFRIKAGEQSFADCAKEYSQGQEAQTGGLLGPVPLSQPHPAIAQKLSISQPGQLWTPIKLENWYVIIRLEKLVAAQLDDTTRTMLLNHLFEQWLAEQLQITPISLNTNDNSPIPSASTPVLVTQ